MPGLNLMGGIGAFAGPGTQPPASSVTEAAFGSGYTDTQPSGRASALAPTHPMGIAFWGGVAAVAGYAFLYHSLPADRRDELELILLALVLWGPAKGLAKMSLQRLAQEGETQGITDSLARAGVWILT